MSGSHYSIRVSGDIGLFEAIWQPGLILICSFTFEVNIMRLVVAPVFVLGISVSTLA